MRASPVSIARLENASIDAAIAQAAHDTLVEMFPSQAEIMRGHMRDEMAAMPRYGQCRVCSRPQGREGGAGDRRSGWIRARRAALGIEFIPSNEPGKWRQDPISKVPLALGANWGEVKPLVLESGAQFRVPPPPALDSPEYAAAFKEVKRLGGDGQGTRDRAYANQTAAGIYWAYDGTPSLCAPPRLYNQIIMNIADQMGTDVVELSRLLALANVAMSDAGIAIWESKYYYQFWRPITGIREADPGPVPASLATATTRPPAIRIFRRWALRRANLQWAELHAAISRVPVGSRRVRWGDIRDPSPLLRTDDIPFTFVSDEYNGETLDNQGRIRPLLPRSFKSLSQAEEENGQSRIYLGIHWSFDKTAGIEQGRQVAGYVFENALR